jgi:hypothetical protein
MVCQCLPLFSVTRTEKESSYPMDKSLVLGSIDIGRMRGDLAADWDMLVKYVLDIALNSEFSHAYISIFDIQPPHEQSKKTHIAGYSGIATVLYSPVSTSASLIFNRLKNSQKNSHRRT